MQKSSRTLVKSVIQALIMSFIITALLTGILSIMIVSGKVQEDAIQALGIGVSFAATLISVFAVSKKHGSKAMVIALLFSACTILIIGILTALIAKSSNIAGTLPLTASSVLLGAILGALFTLKRKKRRKR